MAENAPRYVDDPPSTADVLRDSESARALRQAAPMMFESLERYRLQRGMVSGFLVALLSNDFIKAATKADSQNALILRLYALYIHNVLPPDAYGSASRVHAWTSRRPVPPVPEVAIDNLIQAVNACDAACEDKRISNAMSEARASIE